MKNKMDIIFAPKMDENPKLIISIKKFHHVYFGLYKGFDQKTLKKVTRYFWAEHGTEQLFFRCLITEDLKNWHLDAIANNLIKPFPVTKIQTNVFNEIEASLIKFINKDGILLKPYQDAIIEGGSPLLILKEEDDSADFSPAECNILNTLNQTWRLDASIQFG